MPLYDNLGREIAHEPKPRRKSVPRPRNLKPQRRKPTSETSPLPKSFEVRLTARHNINGEFYGPGMVTVKSKPLADTLLEQERNAARADAQFAGTRADRKSTRLNSSHSQISYAVFCLKKKK